MDDVSNQFHQDTSWNKFGMNYASWVKRWEIDASCDGGRLIYLDLQFYWWINYAYHYIVADYR